jgi:para-nitrobenzyl esterase
MKRKILIACAALALGFGVAWEMAEAASPTTLVTTTDGQLRGKAEGDVMGFMGVPFAAPPVGALRWHEPMPVKPWAGVRDAVAFGAPCAQAAMGWNDNVAAKSSEDCLTLNVWTPVRRSGPLPVLVFFPGGAYHGGGAEGLSEIEPSYDGGKLAARGIIVVTAGYRLGMFGFLAHPELTAESPHHVSGNYAMLDNIAVLNWVKTNIARFGGDPTQVTISGQSAGAFTVGDLMTSPLAKGLFSKVIAHSGTVMSRPVPSLTQAEAVGAAFVKQFGPGDQGAIARLRKLPAEQLIKVMMATPAFHASEPRGPVLDHYVFAEQPAAVFQAGREDAVPLMVGNTARDGDEDSMGVSGTPKADATLANKARPISATHKVTPLGGSDLKQVQAYYAKYGDLAGQAAKLYGDTKTTAPVDGDAIHAFETDTIFRCGADVAAAWHSKVAPTWQFQTSAGYEPLGAVHLWDMFYLFGWLKAPADQPRDKLLADQMQGYWVSFVKNGDPNAPGLPSWPKSGAGNAYLDFTSSGAMAKKDLRAAACGIYAQKTERDLATLERSSH